MQNKFKILLITSIVFVVSGLGWWVLNSSRFSNNSMVINIKSLYYLKLLPKIGFDGHYLTYTIIPIKKDERFGYYTYSLLGKFEKIDFEKNLIYLKDNRGQKYVINFFTRRVLSNTAKIAFDYNEYINKKPATKNAVEIDVFNRNKTEVPFKVGDNIQIQWDSFKNISQLLSDKVLDTHILIERESIVIGATQIVNAYIYEN